VRNLRLGDIIDDWCVKCRRLTNHAIVSLMEAEAAKVRCRSCYSDHNYLKEIAPPSKKELKKLADAALAATGDAPEIVPEGATRKSSA
jgi:formate dehydrogenase maturation protein FdhE